MGIKNWLAKKFGTIESREVVPINQALQDRDNQIQVLSTALQAKEGEISYLNAKSRENETLNAEVEEKRKFINELISKQNQIDQEKLENCISFRNLFRYLEKHPKFKISVMDRDMSVKLAGFQDIIITKDGDLAIVDDSGTIVSAGKETNHVFYKPGSLMGQMKKGLVRLPCDEKWRANPDLEEIEVPEGTYNHETGKIKWSAIRTKPLKKIIQAREEKIGSLSLYIEQLEETNTLVSKELEDKKRANKNLSQKVDIYRTDLSKANNELINMKKKFGGVKTRNAQLQSTNAFLSSMKDKMEGALNELSDMVTEKLAKDDQEIFNERVKETVDWIEEKFPKQINPPEKVTNERK